ncbi:vWA domain-containing protein [Liberibacter crescens]|nr:TadE/TadG family type IV pilus assembly protein [Liberibacter crescens]AMC12481.1 hypothetical protein RL73_01400 [Liberibacter crescens]
MQSSKGNFLFLTAVILPVMIGIVGFAIDVVNVMYYRYALQAASDRAILTTNALLSSKETNISEQKIKEIVQNNLEFNLYHDFGQNDAQEISQDADIAVTRYVAKKKGALDSYRIVVQPDYDMPINPFSFAMRFLGKEYVSLATYSEGVAGGVKNQESQSVSLELVVDVSGSMRYPPIDKNGYDYTHCFSDAKMVDPMLEVVIDPQGEKIFSTDRYLITSCNPLYYPGVIDGSKLKRVRASEVQKTAAAKVVFLRDAVFGLVRHFDSLENSAEKIRMGAVAFDGTVKSKSPMNWGTKHIKDYFINLESTGGSTNSTPALYSAYKMLSAAQEDLIHKAKNNQNIKKYIIFLTDGENDPGFNETSIPICKAAKAKGIRIFAIGFSLEALSTAHKFLTDCASPGDYYDVARALELSRVFQNIASIVSSQVNRLTK